MTIQDRQVLTFENVNLRALNFGGTLFSNPGERLKRSFGFDLDRETGLHLLQEGWPVKQTKPWDGMPEDWEPTLWMKTNVSFPQPGQRFQPPKIVQITKRGMITLDEDAVKVLDYAPMLSVDLSIRARHWVYTATGNEGFSAELSEMYATLDESPLAVKYGACVGPDCPVDPMVIED